MMRPEESRPVPSAGVADAAGVGAMQDGRVDGRLTLAPGPGGGPTMAEPVSLDGLRPGQCGLVCQIEAVVEDIERLKVMGICLGRRVQVVRAGNPMIVGVMGARIGLARALARLISVAPSDRPVCCQSEAGASAASTASAGEGS